MILAFLNDMLYIQNTGIMVYSYISGKVYSEPWYDGTFLYFGKCLFRALA